ncbi:hypothetical protein E4U11_003146 [Claviceps purpurea]|nr:hypothetical protein E4U11_003146 [Claviceps purpurea]
MTPGFVHHMPKRTAAAGTSHVGPWSGRRSVAAPLSAELLHLPASSSTFRGPKLASDISSSTSILQNFTITARLILHLDATVDATELLAQIPLTPFTPRRHRPPRPSHEELPVPR